MILALLFFAIGLALSAFFSGSETGMYRVSRIRLVLDALSGSRVARGLIWLLNHPSLFVATSLVGNNIANYFTSLSVVLAAVVLLPTGGTTVELLGPILLTPVIFVCGELLPKYLFFNAPYRLLRFAGAPLLVFTVLLLPITIALGLLGQLLSLLTGQAPFRVQMGMARAELEQVLREGHEAGLLGGTQRTLAQNVFQVGNQPAIRFGVSPERLTMIERLTMSDQASERNAACRAARRQEHPIVLVKSEGQIVGYYWYAELVAASPENPPTLRSVVRGRSTQKHFSVLLELCESDSDVALLSGKDGSIRAVVTRRQLLQPLLAPVTPS